MCKKVCSENFEEYEYGDNTLDHQYPVAKTSATDLCKILEYIQELGSRGGTPMRLVEYEVAPHPEEEEASLVKMIFEPCIFFEE